MTADARGPDAGGVRVASASYYSDNNDHAEIHTCAAGEAPRVHSQLTYTLARGPVIPFRGGWFPNITHCARD